MKFEILILPEAVADLYDIWAYFSKHDSVPNADSLINRLEEAIRSLQMNPERGHCVPELKRIHVEGFREIHHKPYRIIFQILFDQIYVHAVVDGRRELQEIMEQRILR